jgi:hypothetical protein
VRNSASQIVGGDENHGRNYPHINGPKRLRWGNPRQSTKADDLTDSRENTQPIQPIPGGEQTHLDPKPTVLTSPLVRQKIVSPVSRYPAVNKPILKPTSNPISSIEAELAEIRRAWERYRSTNSRDAIYIYLTAVFGIVMRWQRLNCALKKSRAALRLRPNPPQMKPEPFAIVIFCTADPKIVDAKTRSKWSRVLRYAARVKPAGQRLTDFVKSNGGLNECARKFAQVG